MKRNNDYTDLDALVLAELESLDRGRSRHAPLSKAGPTRIPQKANEGRPLVRVSKAPFTRIHGEDRAEQGITGEEAETLFETPLDEMTRSNTDEVSQSSDSLFSPEEQAFMSRAVGFLTGRENADMILGQIWERMTGDHPEEFYAADEAFEPAPQPSQDQVDPEQSQAVHDNQDDTKPAED